MNSTKSDLIESFRLETEFYQDHIRHTKQSLREWRKAEGDWDFHEVLGIGAFGIVHKQVQRGRDRVRAVKTIATDRLPAKMDYTRELHVLALLAKHKSQFVEFWGWFEDTEKFKLYIAMEYFALGDLRKNLNTPLPEEVVQTVTIQLLEGLGVMHGMGIAHRDLKPDNIFVVSVSPVWLVKLGDFGVSKRVLPELNTSFHTQIRTPLYAAPELQGLRDDSDTSDYTNAVDIWSLGCVVYELLAGERLFTDFSRVVRYSHGKWLFPADTLSKLPVPVSDPAISFIRGLVTLKPQDRPSATSAIDHEWLKEVPRVIRDDCSENEHYNKAVATADTTEKVPRVLVEPFPNAKVISEKPKRVINEDRKGLSVFYGKTDAEPDKNQKKPIERGDEMAKELIKDMGCDYNVATNLTVLTPTEQVPRVLVEPFPNAKVISEKLKRVINEDRKGLSVFYGKNDVELDKNLKRPIERGEEMAKELIKDMGCDYNVATNLTVLTLYDLAILIDDSKAMAEVGKDTRKSALIHYVDSITRIYKLAKPTGILTIRFLNSRRGKANYTAKSSQAYLDQHTYSGTSRIGTGLKEKILDKYIYCLEQRRPLLVLVVTQGQIGGEKQGHLRNVIRDCVSERVGAGKGFDAVTFQLSCIGNDLVAIKHLKAIAQEKQLRGFVDFLHIEIDLERQLENDRWLMLPKILLGAILPKANNQARDEDSIPGFYGPGSESGDHSEVEELVVVAPGAKEIDRRLKRLICVNREGLTNFYGKTDAERDKNLKIPIERGEKMAKKLINNMGCGYGVAQDLTVLTLYDLAILIDDSCSMDGEDGDAGLQTLIQYIDSITIIYKLANPTGILATRFLNNSGGKTNWNQRSSKSWLEKHTYGGMSRIGTELKEKILDPFIYETTRPQSKPLLVLIVTWGLIEGEREGYLEDVIYDCVHDQSYAGMGFDSVTFQFSCIGNDPRAIKLLKALDQDNQIGEFIDVLPIGGDFKHQLDEDPWFVLPKILLGAILPDWDEQDYYDDNEQDYLGERTKDGGDVSDWES